MQLRTASLGKIVVVTGFAGMLMGLGVWFAVPNEYASEAILQVVPSQGADPRLSGEALSDYLNRGAVKVLSDSSLTEVVRKYHLYSAKQAKMPLEDILRGMKENILIAPVRLFDMASFEFVYEDPGLAQRVAQDLATRIQELSINDAGFRSDAITIRMLNTASRPTSPISPNVVPIVVLGLVVGLAIGVMLARFRRAPNPA